MDGIIHHIHGHHCLSTSLGSIGRLVHIFKRVAQWLIEVLLCNVRDIDPDLWCSPRRSIQTSDIPADVWSRALPLSVGSSHVLMEKEIWRKRIELWFWFNWLPIYIKQFHHYHRPWKQAIWPNRSLLTINPTSTVIQVKSSCDPINYPSLPPPPRYCHACTELSYHPVCLWDLGGSKHSSTQHAQTWHNQH